MYDSFVHIVYYMRSSYINKYYKKEDKRKTTALLFPGFSNTKRNLQASPGLLNLSAMINYEGMYRLYRYLNNNGVLKPKR